jgi:hypothetical protein
MGAMNWYQMYDIDTSTIWQEALGKAADIPDDCFKELYSQYHSLMMEKDEKYVAHIEKEEYYAERHFHFVYLYERAANRSMQERTGYQDFSLGYIMLSNDKLDKKIWLKEIPKILKKELPEQIAKNTLENTEKLAQKFLSPDTPEDEKTSWINYQMSRHTIEEKRINEDDNQEAYRWTYDVYWFRHSRIVLSYNKEDIEERKYFIYFFAWAVATIEIEQIDDFLKYHLANSFEDKWDDFGRFLEILLMKHEGSLLSNNQVKLVRKWLETNPYGILIPTNKINNTVDNQSEGSSKLEDNYQKLGRKSVEKIIIPKPIPRKGKLFSYLAQLNCVFMGKPDMSKASFASAIEVLTGFSASQMEEFLMYESWMPKNKKEKIAVLENIKELINSKL